MALEQKNIVVPGNGQTLNPGEAAEEQTLPPVGEPVWVRGDGFRTLAWRDAKGVWWALGTGKALAEVVSVIRER